MARIKIFQADIGLRWLTLQNGRFKAIRNSSHDSRWTALSYFINHYSELIGLETFPLPFFGDSYYVSGSFIYYKKLSMRLDRDYYELCVDHTDPPVFWPLIVHEIAHCWLSKHEYVDDILSQHSSDIRDITLDIAASRIEESLCDIIATKLMGPAYPFAFINRLWAQLDLESPDYPKNCFRIECMAKVLDLDDFNDESISLRNLSDAEFQFPYDDEQISCTLDDLCSVSQVLPSLYSEIVKKESQYQLSKIKLKKSEDLSSIFYASWLKIIQTDVEEVDSTINLISDILLSSLIGASESCHSPT